MEAARAARLSDEVTAWRAAADARDYLDALRELLPGLSGEDQERVGAWCAWIVGRIERTDPSLNVAQIRGVDDDRDRFFVHPAARTW